MTADCLPVLFCDRRGTAIAAAHAGWRGLAKGILADTIACFDQPAGELMAWLGPAIGPCHFEVGAEVRAAFYDNPQFAGVEHLTGAFVPSAQAGHYYCDLYALARHSMRLGVWSVSMAAIFVPTVMLHGFTLTVGRASAGAWPQLLCVNNLCGA